MERKHTQRRRTSLTVRTRFAWAAVAALVAVSGLSVSSGAQPTRTARGTATTNAAIEWNSIASTALMTTAAQPPHVAVLSLAMVQGAVYDAVNAIDGGHEPYLDLAVRRSRPTRWRPRLRPQPSVCWSASPSARRR